jgi:sugar O-acyltransferase (sialic acid O-acetyltransferase NeuD family)
MSEKVVIFGAGGHAKVVIEAIESAGHYQIAFLSDSNPDITGTMLKGYPIRSVDDGLSFSDFGVSRGFVAVGKNKDRERIASDVKQKGLALVTVVHPAAMISTSAVLGAGTLIMPRSIINADSTVGYNVIINSGAIIEHDCEIGDNAHVGPGATLCGGVKIGRGSLIGAGAIILPGVTIGNFVVVGAGAVVLSSIPDGTTNVGVPARRL